MSRETKLGIVFIGILLFVFGALLVKKLTRPSNRGLQSIAAKPPDVTSDVSTTPRQPQASPPTLVTPKTDAGNPTGFATSGDRYATPSTSTPWTRSQSENSPAAAVIAAPIPIADLSDRYADRSNSARADANDSNTSSGAAGGQRYRTGYGSASEDASSASATSSLASTSPRPTAAGTDPFQNRDAASANSTDGVITTPQQNDAPNSKPVAAITSRNLQSAGSLVSARETAATGIRANDSSSRYPASQATDPFHKVAGQELQPYNSQVAAGSFSEPTRANSWERPATTASPTSQAPRYGNNTAAPAVAMSNELSSPSAAVASISRDGDQYSVQPNDSYWTISEKAYGTGAFFKALHEHNRKKYKDADDLHIGQVLSVPDEGVLRRAYPDLCPRPRTTVASAQQRLVSATSRMRDSGASLYGCRWGHALRNRRTRTRETGALGRNLRAQS